MPAPLNVNREAVKTLAIAIGVREAARRMGLPEKTVLAWSHRHHWFANPAETAPVIRGQRSVQSSAVIDPAAALALTLAERHGKSRLHLSKYVMDASSKSAKSKGNHKLARSTREVATIMEKVWPNERENNAQTLVSVQILNER